MRLLAVEMQRDLARRLTWILVGIAFGIIVVVCLAVFGANDPLEDELAPGAVIVSPVNDDPRFLTSVWPEREPAEGSMIAPVLFLTITAYIAGASMIGAEWKAGTFTNLLTWEPRRVRVLGAKFGAAGVLAAVIGAGLLTLFVLAFLPTVLVKGSTVGANREWVAWLAGGILRIALATGMAAVFGAAVAMIGRNTAAAVGVAFGYFTVAENLVRGLRPRWQPWLLSENTAIWVTRGHVDPGFDRSPTEAVLTLALYLALAVFAAWVLFSRRDIAGEA